MPEHTIFFKNTLTGQKAPFVPLNPAKVGMYVCGITPYDDAHLGHARAYVVFDVVYRLLKKVYDKSEVTYVRNFTDIDDKIIQRAEENHEAPMDLANRVIAGFHADMRALNTLPPTHEPRVSDPTVLRGIVAHIQKLLERGYAYVAPNGDVNYRTAKFPTYGQLAGRKLDEQRAGARVAVDDGKESPHDFVLWKANANSATKLVQAFHPVELGASFAGFTAPGRPGWHIECSVMSAQTLLGEGATTFDIHGGGEDLQFPHHSCEIAQTEALTGQPMAQVWLHNAFITVGGTKMSKSLGNFTTIKDVLTKHSPQAVRLWLLQTHYRKPVDYSPEAVEAAENAVSRFRSAFERLEQAKAEGLKNGWLVEDQKINSEVYSEGILRELCNDLGTDSLTYLFDHLNDLLNELTDFFADKNQLNLQSSVNVAGALERNLEIFGLEGLAKVRVIDEDLEELISKRLLARKNKDWSESDRLRNELIKYGVVLEDHSDGTTTWRRER